MANNFSAACNEVLSRLASARNVLVSGPPGTGKSILLGEVAKAFELGVPKPGAAPLPVHNPRGAVPIPPAVAETPAGYAKAMPAAAKTARKVFRTVFHQNSKHRDFTTGMIPNVARKVGDPEFTMIKGVLYQASEHAKQVDGASLLVIDEINRGPAVQVFGGAIVAIEGDKRLAPDGTTSVSTQFFDLLDPSGAGIVAYALPADLYILAAMNQADASVEPLDVAFLRRWEPYLLEADSGVLRRFFGIDGANAGEAVIPEVATDAKHLYEASVRAWQAVNKRITLGRGPEFQIGHGVFMATPPLATVAEACAATAIAWSKVRAHVNEVFFGDLRGTAATLNAIDGPAFHPLRLQETTFADDVRFYLEGPARIGPDRIYDFLRAVATS